MPHERERNATEHGERSTPGAGSTAWEPGSRDRQDDDAVEAVRPRAGNATGASGGYGVGSGSSSGGSGEGTDETSSPGEDVQTDWLRGGDPIQPSESDGG